MAWSWEEGQHDCRHSSTDPRLCPVGLQWLYGMSLGISLTYRLQVIQERDVDTATASAHPGDAPVRGAAGTWSTLLFSLPTTLHREVLPPPGTGGREASLSGCWNRSLSQGFPGSQVYAIPWPVETNMHMLTSRCLGHTMAELQTNFRGSQLQEALLKYQNTSVSGRPGDSHVDIDRSNYEWAGLTTLRSRGP